MTTHEEAAEMFGKVVYRSDKYQVHVIEKDNGLHTYTFRVVEGAVMIPLAFLLGGNSSWYEEKHRLAQLPNDLKKLQETRRRNGQTT